MRDLVTANAAVTVIGLAALMLGVGNFAGRQGTTGEILALQCILASPAFATMLLSAAFAGQRQVERRALAAEARLLDAIESMSEAFALFDSDDRLVLANSRHREDYAKGSAVMVPGTRFEDILRSGVALGQHPDAAGQEEEWIAERMRRHRHPDGAFEQLLGDGRWERISERRTQDGGTVGVWTDISQLKRQEHALRENERRLHQTIMDLRESRDQLRLQAADIEKLAAEIESQRQAAEALSQAKSDFLATMSHEVRTPLNGILGFAQLLLERLSAPEDRKCAETIHESGKALLTIMNDVLDYSKIEAGKLELEQSDFNPASILRGVCTLMEESALRKGLTLSLSISDGVPHALNGDPGRLRQIVLNLVSNAVKFTEKGRVDVELSLVSATPTQARVRVEVRDTGVGIPAQAQKALFQPFIQVLDKQRRNMGGTGLGLSICKRLVTLLGGDIGFESVEGQGSRFWFEVQMPFGAQSIASQLKPARVETVGNRATADILVVDDIEENREIARAFLTSAGHRVDVAVSGSAALAALSDKHYDIVFMDVQMPEMDGVETSMRIRAMVGKKRHTPIIAMTAYAAKRDQERFLRSGMDDHLAKPIDKNSMLAVVDRWLGRASNANASAGFVEVHTGALPILAIDELDRLEGTLGREKVARFAWNLIERLGNVGDNLRAELSEGSMVALRDEAHALASVGSNMGAHRVSAVCREIQGLVGDGNVPSDSARLSALVEQTAKDAEETARCLRERYSEFEPAIVDAA